MTFPIIAAMDAPVDGQVTAIVGFRAVQDKGGLKWEAVLIAPGVSTSSPPFNWSEAVLSRDCQVFEGARIGVYELRPDYMTHIRGAGAEEIKQLLVKNDAGKATNVRYEQGVGVVADITFLPSFADLAANLSADPESKGLSVVVQVMGVKQENGVWDVHQIVRCDTVDVVNNPAAGGQFRRVLQSKGGQVKEKLLALLAKWFPSMLAGKDTAALTEEDVIQIAQAAMDGLPEIDEGPGEEPQAVAQDDPENKTATIGELRAALQEVEQRAACRELLTAKLDQSDLPRPVRRRVAKLFEGKIFKPADLDAGIKAELDYIAEMDVPGFGDLADQTRRIVVGPGPLAKVQIALDRLFGIDAATAKVLEGLTLCNGKPVFAKVSQDMDGVPAFDGIAHGYAYLTGDTAVEGRFFRDRLPAELRVLQDINNSSWAEVFGNTLNRRLAASYAQANYHEDAVVSSEKAAKDFRDQEAIMLGYFPDLAVVDTDSADFAEIAGITDEKASYSVQIHGNTLTLSWKAIVNDDLTAVRRTVEKLGRAARRTKAKKVWSPFINNGLCSDGTAWFTAPHSNLGSAAMGFPSVTAAYIALASMTEKDSGEPLGLLDDEQYKPTLVYPVNLMEKGNQIKSAEYYYSGADVSTKIENFLKGKINTVALSLLNGDPNDWGLIMPPGVMEIMECAYLHGKKEPELILANQPQSGAFTFFNNSIKYRIVFVFNVALVDYRSGYKAIVP